MSKVISYILVFALGLVAGWYLAQPGSSRNHSVASLQPVSNVANLANQSAQNDSWDSHNFEQQLILNQVESTFKFLTRPDLPAEHLVVAKKLFHQHLNGLFKQRQWNRLSQWIERARYFFYDDPEILRLAAEIEWQKKDYDKALNTYFAAFDATWEPEAKQQLLTRIEALLSSRLEIKDQQQNSLNPQSTAMALLNIALEKQPQYAPFVLMMANKLEASGDLEGALYQLELAPYSEHYQDEIDNKKASLMATIANLEQQTQGIALLKSGDHFVVDVVFNEAVTLRLLIDTGASVTALSARALAKLNQASRLRDTGNQVRVNTANGAIVSKLYQIDSMRIDDWSQNNIEILQVPLPETQEIDGLLGMNFLSQYIFSIDQSQARLYLQPRP